MRDAGARRRIDRRATRRAGRGEGGGRAGADPGADRDAGAEDALFPGRPGRPGRDVPSLPEGRVTSGEGMEALAALAGALERPDQEIEPGRAALLIAALEYPDLDVDAYLDRLAGLADEARARLAGRSESDEVVRVLADLLHREHGFAGNSDAYYDPRNSYLNDVLDRRLGIPITLSVLYLDIGRRLGLPLEGVGMPGH